MYKTKIKTARDLQNIRTQTDSSFISQREKDLINNGNQILNESRKTNINFENNSNFIDSFKNQISMQMDFDLLPKFFRDIKDQILDYISDEVQKNEILAKSNTKNHQFVKILANKFIVSLKSFRDNLDKEKNINLDIDNTINNEMFEYLKKHLRDLISFEIRNFVTSYSESKKNFQERKNKEYQASQNPDQFIKQGKERKILQKTRTRIDSHFIASFETERMKEKMTSSYLENEYPKQGEHMGVFRRVYGDGIGH